MRKVHLIPWSWVVAGVAALALLHATAGLSVAGWVAGLTYLIVSTTLLTAGLTHRGATGFGPANAVTATRSMLVGLITALTVSSFTQPVPAGLVVGLTVPALLLDAVDGWVAQRVAGAEAVQR